MVRSAGSWADGDTLCSLEAKLLNENAPALGVVHGRCG